MTFQVNHIFMTKEKKEGGGGFTKLGLQDDVMGEQQCWD